MSVQQKITDILNSFVGKEIPLDNEGQLCQSFVKNLTNQFKALFNEYGEDIQISLTLSNSELSVHPASLEDREKLLKIWHL